MTHLTATMPPQTPAPWVIWSLFALALMAAPVVFASALSHALLSQMGIAIIACLSFNILLGQGGMLSFGHAVYSGVGSFLAIHALGRVSGGLALPVSLIPLVGGVGGLLLGALLGWLSTKRAGTPFAMITLGIGELVWAVSLMFPEVFGGDAGIAGNRVSGVGVLGITFGPQWQVYYLIALYTFVCTALMYAFTHTPLGTMLKAVRDNPQRTESVGYDTQVVRYLAFMIAAFFAGISGGLAALNFEIATSEVFSGYRSGAYLLFTLLGGTTYFAGPIIGGVLMVLSSVLLSRLTQAWLLYLGLLFVFMVMVAPGGVASLAVLGSRPATLGRIARSWRRHLALGLSALVGSLGVAAIVEMLYHLQLRSALGDRLDFLGLVLDSSSPGSWIAASGMLLGWGWFVVLRRRLARQRSAPQGQPHEAMDRHRTS